MFTGESDKAWKAYGRTEPYYGVLSDERFRKKHLTPRALEEFFRSGEQDLDFFLATIRRHFDHTGPGSSASRVIHYARKIVPLLNNFATLMERKPFFAPMMQMNRANLNRVFCRLQKCGCENVIVRFTNHGNELGLILFFKIPGA